MVIAAFVVVTLIPSYADEASSDHVEELIAESILDELEDSNDSGDVRSAVRYVIPVPIKVVIPVPRPAAPTPSQPERDPIIAVPIGVSPGPYPSWRPIGPPVLAIPIGSPSQYPYDDDDFERRALSGEMRKPQKAGKRNERNRAQAGIRAFPTAHTSPRRTRSINEEDPKIKNGDVFRRDLPLGYTQETVRAKDIYGVDIPYRVSTKTLRSNSGQNRQAAGHVRRKRQYYGSSNYNDRGRYNHPT